MSALKIFLLTLSLFLIAIASANTQEGYNEIKANDVTNDTGTFSVKEEEEPLKMQSEEERIQEEEEAELDSFGEDKYNRNVDPDEKQR